MDSHKIATRPTLTSIERLGAWLIVCFFTFLTVLNLYLRETELPRKTGDAHEMGISLIEVTVKGAVKHPGVYQVEKGALVEEVLAVADPLDDADLKRMKMESKILRRRTIQVRVRKPAKTS
ncbi:MAG: SLBB domain-containing protein [Waddliaceae bacterium]